jgi:hypothetical protein
MSLQSQKGESPTHFSNPQNAFIKFQELILIQDMKSLEELERTFFFMKMELMKMKSYSPNLTQRKDENTLGQFHKLLTSCGAQTVRKSLKHLLRM